MQQQVPDSRFFVVKNRKSTGGRSRGSTKGRHDVLGSSRPEPSPIPGNITLTLIGKEISALLIFYWIRHAFMPRTQNNELNSQTSIQISRLLACARGGVARRRKSESLSLFRSNGFLKPISKNNNRIRNRNEAIPKLEIQRLNRTLDRTKATKP